MPESKKRALQEIEATSSPSPKRARHDTQPTSSAIYPNDSPSSVPPSSPTLVGSDGTSETSVSNSSTDTDERNDAEETDFSSSSDTGTFEVAEVIRSVIPRSLLEAANIEARLESETSASSISDEETTSSESESESQSESDESDYSDVSSIVAQAIHGAAPIPKPPTGPLTMKNLNKLQQRLDSLLPELASANAQLDDDRVAGVLEQRNIENVNENGEDGRGYIEMNLGLGVLKERGAEHSNDESQDSDISSKGVKAEETSRNAYKDDIITKMLQPSKKKRKVKVKIEEVSGG